METTHFLQLFCLLAKGPGITAQISITTPYGLVVEFNSETPLKIRLKDEEAATAKSSQSKDNVPTPENYPGSDKRPKMEKEPEGTIGVNLESSSSTRIETQSPELGFQYFVFPEYGTNFLNYEPGWPGNPEDGFVVNKEEIEDLYPAAWYKAYYDWFERYIDAFEAQECQLGSGKEPMPDPEVRNPWVVEGALLVSWLALQKGVDQVAYSPECSESHKFKKGSVEESLECILKSLSWDFRSVVSESDDA